MGRIQEELLSFLKEKEKAVLSEITNRANSSSPSSSPKNKPLLHLPSPPVAKQNSNGRTKVILVGDSSVGKSCFIQRYIEGQWPKHQIVSTVGLDVHTKTLMVDDEKVTLDIWDTCGQERYASLTQSHFRGAQGIVFMYDITDEVSIVLALLY